jgi:alpha-1,6-mannosyltransferase
MSGRLLAAAVVLSGCTAVWALRGDQTGHVAQHLALYGAAFVAYLVALQASAGLSTRGLRYALGAAFFWRAALVLAPPLASDDVHRTVWEGRIQLQGGNPYSWRDRPAAEHWAGLRDDDWARMNHKDYTAIYPPLWQLVAAGIVAVHDSVTAVKVFLVACEALLLWTLAGLLRRRSLPAERLLVLAWSPLALVEVAGSGHSEPLGALFLVLALHALETGRPVLSAALAALGFQVKLLPGLVALAWGHCYRLRHTLAAGLVAAALLVPYLGAGRGLLRSLEGYASFWRFNETLFAPLAALLGAPAAVVASAFALTATALVLAWRRVEPSAAALAVVAGTLLLAPSVFPWYALWLLPLLVLRDAPGALLFTGSVGLAYLVYPAWHSGEPWQVSWGVRALEYGPCLAVTLWSHVKAPVASPRLSPSLR